MIPIIVTNLRRDILFLLRTALKRHNILKRYRQLNYHRPISTWMGWCESRCWKSFSPSTILGTLIFWDEYIISTLKKINMLSTPATQKHDTLWDHTTCKRVNVTINDWALKLVACLSCPAHVELTCSISIVLYYIPLFFRIFQALRARIPKTLLSPSLCGTPKYDEKK